MTLGAIAAAIGLIIDDAIVVVEQIHRTHEEHPMNLHASLCKKRFIIYFPQWLAHHLSTIVIFIPFELMSGVAGAYFKVMTNTMIITCVLILCYMDWSACYVFTVQENKRNFSTKKAKNPRSKKTEMGFIFYLSAMDQFYNCVVPGICHYSYCSSALETGFLPEMDEGSIVLDYNIATRHFTWKKQTGCCGRWKKLLLQFQKSNLFTTNRNADGFFITEPNSGDYLIQLKRKTRRTTDEVIEDIRKR